MKYIISRYNHEFDWIKDYTDDCIMYDRSEEKATGNPELLVIPVKNVGSDISDKFKFIIENYNNLPDVAVYTKCNLFKYITKPEYDQVKDNKTFTPLLTQTHKVYEPTCRYTIDGLYEEINNYWYLNSHPTKNNQTFEELKELLTFNGRKYLQFCPGSNFILTKEDILRHPIELYIKLKKYLDWTVYGGECQMIERGLYYLWGTELITQI